MTKITFDYIFSKAKEYKFEIIFMILIVIFASLAKTLFNFFLDWRIVIILVAILWYLGYLNRVQSSLKEKLLTINYFKNMNVNSPDIPSDNDDEIQVNNYNKKSSNKSSNKSSKKSPNKSSKKSPKKSSKKSPKKSPKKSSNKSPKKSPKKSSNKSPKKSSKKSSKKSPKKSPKKSKK